MFAYHNETKLTILITQNNSYFCICKTVQLFTGTKKTKNRSKNRLEKFKEHKIKANKINRRHIPLIISEYSNI